MIDHPFNTVTEVDSVEVDEKPQCGMNLHSGMNDFTAGLV